MLKMLKMRCFLLFFLFRGTSRGLKNVEKPLVFEASMLKMMNLNARTRERLPTSSVTVTSCSPSPTCPHLGLAKAWPVLAPLVSAGLPGRPGLAAPAGLARLARPVRTAWLAWAAPQPGRPRPRPA